MRPQDNHVSLETFRYVVRCEVEPKNLSFDSNFLKREEDNFVVSQDGTVMTIMPPNRPTMNQRVFGNYILVQKSGVVYCIADSVAAVQENLLWLSRKLAFKNPISKIPKELESVAGKVSIPPNFYVDVESLVESITLSFAHWSIVYDPEAFPSLLIRRDNQKLASEGEKSKESTEVATNATDSAASVPPKEEVTTKTEVEETNTLPLKEPAFHLSDIKACPPQLQPIVQNLLNQELEVHKLQQNFIAENKFDRNTAVLGLPGEWMRTTLVVSSRWVTVLHAPSDVEANRAWNNFFPFLSYFLLKIQ